MRAQPTAYYTPAFPFCTNLVCIGGSQTIPSPRAVTPFALDESTSTLTRSAPMPCFTVNPGSAGTPPSLLAEEQIHGLGKHIRTALKDISAALSKIVWAPL